MSNDVFVDVYIAPYPFNVESKEIYPSLREEEISGCKSEKVKNQKFFVWKLLEKAIETSVKVKFKDVIFTKEGDKWSCDKCKFSLSHSQNVVVVVVSNEYVGVDIEKIDLPRFEKMKKEKVLTKEEQQGLQSKDQALYMNQLWAVKEAIFKKENKKVFSPSKINTQKHNYIVKPIKINEQEFVLSVATNKTKKVEFYQI